MKYLKLYESYNDKDGWIDNQPPEEYINNFCKKYTHNYFNDSSWKINSNMSVDVDGYVDFERNERPKFNQIPFKFNRVTDFFNCSQTGLCSLKNTPNYVGGGFSCDYNYKLKTLLGGPNIVFGYYSCENCDLRDVYGFPEFFTPFTPGDPLYDGIDEAVKINNNPVYEIINLTEKEKFHRFIRLLNEYKVIRNQDSIIESRLLDALFEMDIKKSNTRHRMEFENYKLI